MLGLPYYASLLLQFPPSAESVVVEENIEEEVLQVQGMHCVGCEAAIQRAVHQLPGIITTVVAYKTGTIQVRFDKPKTTPQELQRIIRATGYACVPI